MIGVFNQAPKNSTQDVKLQAKMEEPVTTQQLGMDLLLVVILQNMSGLIIFWNGANNYFQNQLMALQPIAMSSQKSI